MKVRLTYATQIEKVLPKITELIKEKIEPLQKATDLLNASVTMLENDPDDSSAHVVMLVDKVRQSLSQIDESLIDINGLLGGYVKQMIEEPQIPTTPSNEGPPPEAI